MKYNVLIVEDQSMPAKLLEMMLTSSEKYQVVSTITNASNADLFVETQSVDLILMDVLTNGNLNGLEASEIIKKKKPNIKIIIVTSMPEVSYIDKAKAIGIEGFYYKDYGDDNILEVIDQVMEGKICYPESKPVVQIGNLTSNDLSSRDIEVLRLLIDGKTDREIAEILHYSPDTIHVKVKDLLARTGYKTRTRLAVAVRETGFIIND